MKARNSQSADAATKLLAHPLVALGLLLAFCAVMLASLSHKSLTVDEIAHATGGYTYWKFNDYRIQPENGNLPQRVIGLPLVLRDYPFPPRGTPAWEAADEWSLGNTWFFHQGNPAEAMTRSGRAAAALFAVALGALIWQWSRRLFGPLGGMVSLVCYVLNPTILANGALMTSDTASALFFLGAVGSLWLSLRRPGVLTLAGSGVLLGCLCVSKSSAVLIVPIWLLLVLFRAVSGLSQSGGPERQGNQTSWQQFARALAGGIVQAAIALVVIWACYGFRYSAFAESSGRDRFPYSWEFVLGKPDFFQSLAGLNLDKEQETRAAQIFEAYKVQPGASRAELDGAIGAIKFSVLDSRQRDALDRALSLPPPGRIPRLIEFFQQRRLLPEAFLYGQAHVWRFAQQRGAFWNGEVSMNGWTLFFPYTWFVKTPIPFLGVLLIAFAVIWITSRHKRHDDLLFNLFPLGALFVVYWIAILTGNLNIGHRHVIVTYAPLFIVAGAAAGAFASRPKWLATGLLVSLLALAAETAYTFPNYLSYFNGIVRPSQAYRHLVDSSLDWGQDLPAVKKYLERSPAGTAAYLSYFGTASPQFYKIAAHDIFSVPGLDRPADLVAKVIPASSREETLREFPDYLPIAEQRQAENISMLLLKAPAHLRLGPGTYFVSATMLQSVCFEPWGPWTEEYEKRYQELLLEVGPLLSDDGDARNRAVKAHRPADLQVLLRDFIRYRFARLASWLRKRDPDDNLNGSILVYQLTEQDLAAALPPRP